MGTWNCSINGNDLAQDLIMEYRAAFYYNDVETALKKIFNYVGDLDEEETTNFIYSLADFMWKHGILTDDIRNTAIKMIDSNYGLKIWEESNEKNLNKRKKVLQEFKEKITSQQPPVKKISLNLHTTPIFKTGDVIAFQLKTSNLDCSKYSDFNISLLKEYDGKYIVLRKIYDNISYESYIEPNVKDIWPIFQLLPHFYDNLPQIEEITKELTSSINFGIIIYTEGKINYFKKRDYKLIGNINVELEKDYKLKLYEREGIFLGINKPWYHPEVEIINAINDYIKN